MFHVGWQCDNVRASYDEIPKATQDEVFADAKAFVKENKGRYECGGYIYSGEGQELGQFWAKLNVGNAKLQKTSSNTSITEDNGNYSIAGATYGVFSEYHSDRHGDIFQWKESFSHLTFGQTKLIAYNTILPLAGTFMFE